MNEYLPKMAIFWGKWVSLAAGYFGHSTLGFVPSADRAPTVYDTMPCNDITNCRGMSKHEKREMAKISSQQTVDIAKKAMENFGVEVIILARPRRSDELEEISKLRDVLPTQVHPKSCHLFVLACVVFVCHLAFAWLFALCFFLAL